VQDAVRLQPGSTVIGTPGYVPMEQYVGRATVRSDYYAFAATLLFLLSRCSPADFPLSNLKIDFSSLSGLSRDLSLILGNWLEPDETRRTLRPENALALLEGREPQAGEAAGAGAPPRARKPQGSRVEVVETSDSLVIRFRERGRRQLLPMAAFVVLWLALVAGMVVVSALTKAVFIFIYIPFTAVGLFLLRKVLYGLFGRTTLEFSAGSGFRWVREFFGKKEITAPLSDVGECVNQTAYLINNQPQNVLELEVGARTLRFGEFLSERERQWLAGVINRKLGELAVLAG
jgi:hypothetical protein